jgi:hypothetical protein
MRNLKEFSKLLSLDYETSVDAICLKIVKFPNDLELQELIEDIVDESNLIIETTNNKIDFLYSILKLFSYSNIQSILAKNVLASNKRNIDHYLDIYFFNEDNKYFDKLCEKYSNLRELMPFKDLEKQDILSIKVCINVFIRKIAAQNFLRQEIQNYKDIEEVI